MLALSAVLVWPVTVARDTPDPGQPRSDPYGAEREADESHVVRIPEPMVFDLVRGLGARKGELEANVLVGAPVGGGDDRPVAWAPEIEWAFADGVAIEFELPFADGDLEAYKVAAQFTIGVGARKRFIHGVQAIVETFDGVDAWEFSGLYVPAWRFGRVWSAIALVGLRASAGSDAVHDTELLVNPSVFADVGRRWTVGLEVNVESEFGGDTVTRVVPQVHWEMTDTWMLQAGPAAVFRDGGTDHDFAFRLIWSN